VVLTGILEKMLDLIWSCSRWS